MASAIYQTQIFGFAGPWHGFSNRSALIDYHGKQCAGVARDGAPDGTVATALAGGPLRYRDAEVQIAIAGAPYFDGDLQSTGAPDIAAKLAIEYKRGGADSIARLRGGFAAAIVDAKRNATLLAVDRMGIERLAYAVASDSIVFGSRVDAVARFPARTASIRPQALFDFLLMHMIPSPDTVYDGVMKLRPGTTVTFHAGRLDVRAHWTPVFFERGRADMPALATELREKLRGAVTACRPEAASGSFLSGGLDSSTVTGVLAEVAGRGRPSFSIGFGVEGYDELSYARTASGHFGSQAHEYVVTPADIVAVLPRIAAAYDEPFGNSSAVPTYFCARLAAEHGITHLLAGDGGDEIFGGNERYARQKVFEAYGCLPRWMRAGIVEPLSSLFHPEGRLAPLRKFRSYVDQARVPMPERMESWNFMYRTDLDAMLEPELKSAVDTRYALRLMDGVYQDTGARSLVNRMLHYDWQYTLADNDLRKVGTMCQMAGVRVSYPMLDDALIDLSLAIPPRWKVRGFELRAFFKQAMAGFLPRAIIEKKKHGFGLPFGLWLKTHRALADLIYSLLTDLKSRRIVRGAFLGRLIEDHRTGHPSFFGYAIWDLAMLEAWLAAHGGR